MKYLTTAALALSITFSSAIAAPPVSAEEESPETTSVEKPTLPHMGDTFLNNVTYLPPDIMFIIPKGGLKMNYTDARSSCAGLKGGFDLATITQLKLISQYHEAGTLKNSIQVPDDAIFMSSTQISGLAQITKALNFSNGDQINIDKDGTAHIICTAIPPDTRDFN